MNQSEEGAWIRKRRLIDDARSIAFDAEFYKGHEQIKRLQAEFKEAGWAGKGADGEDLDGMLRREFRQACDDFYKRHEDENNRVIAEKRRLIYELGKLASRAYDKDARQEANALYDQWNLAGKPRPRSVSDQLWNEFKKYKDQISEAGRKAREDHRINQIQYKRDKIDRLNSIISDIESDIYAKELVWQNRPFNPPPYGSRHYDDRMAQRREAERRHEDWIAAKRAKIARLESSIRQLENEIRDLESARFGSGVGRRY